jgi:hypothetical protein
VRPPTREFSADHFNGRHCQSCSGRLLDSLVFFSEPLNQTVRQRYYLLLTLEHLIYSNRLTYVLC